MKSNIIYAASWVLRIVAAGILLQTLYFKFSGAEESVYIFTTLHMEPWGRIGIGSAELVAATLLLIPRTVVLGAAASIGILSGAIFFHLAILGIEVQGDGGLLFGLAVTVFACACILLGLHRGEVRAMIDAARERLPLRKPRPAATAPNR